MMLSKRKNIWLFWKLSLQWSNKKLFFHCPLTHFEAVHKWRHPLREEGRSAKSQRFSISLFSKMGDMGEGGVKNLKKWLIRHLWMAPLTSIFFNSSCIAFLADDSDLHLQFLQQKDTYKISIQIKVFFCIMIAIFI